MATVFSGQNLSHMNLKQLRKAAFDANVNDPVIYSTINQNVNDKDNGRSALVAAIKAK